MNTIIHISDSSAPIQRILQLLAEGHGYTITEHAEDAVTIVVGSPQTVRVERVQDGYAQEITKPFDVDEYLRALARATYQPEDYDPAAEYREAAAQARAYQAGMATGAGSELP